jgi:DNA-binding response OmpR family regulator
MGADKMLVKPMQTRALIQQIEKLLDTHAAKLKKLEAGGVAAGLAAGFAAGIAAGGVTRMTPVKSVPVKATGAKRATTVKKASSVKTAVAKKAGGRKTVLKKAVRKAVST